MVKAQDFEMLNASIQRDSHQMTKDFFLVSLEDEGIYGIDLVISHATIHCLKDVRYGNKIDDYVWGGKERPYQVARKLRELTGQK